MSRLDERARIEIAVQDRAGATIARDAGAQRVELCSALGVGGLTPSWGVAKSVVATKIDVHALVRPRAGGFIYTPEEIATTVDDIKALADLGVAGIVVGALNDDRSIDEAAMETLCEAAGQIDVTFHRALDVVLDPIVALDLLINLGVKRVLTSGQAPRAGEGVPMLARMVQHCGDKIDIQAGGGVTLDDISTLIENGIRDIHLSARKQRIDAGPSGPGGGDAAFDATDPDLVAAAVKACAR